MKRNGDKSFGDECQEIRLNIGKFAEEKILKGSFENCLKGLKQFKSVIILIN